MNHLVMLHLSELVLRTLLHGLDAHPARSDEQELPYACTEYVIHFILDAINAAPEVDGSSGVIYVAIRLLSQCLVEEERHSWE